MEQFLAILVVLVVAAAFYGISYLRKKRLYPTCDQFARRYCEIADRLLADVDEQVNLQVVSLDGGLCQLKPLEQQSKAAQAALQKSVDDAMLSDLRDLFFLRDEIQSQASNGNFSKDKYNAITNQLFDSLNLYLSLLNNPAQVLSTKDLDQIHYFLQKQTHIRTVSLPSIVSRACAESLAA
ncbi:MAG: hypothetical protein VB091_06680 [Christensenella sp.]|nr:hypothetical protein [Christensenella sp.]